jgi:hypothetical protein
MADFEPATLTPQRTDTSILKPVESDISQTALISSDPFSPENHQLPSEEIRQMYQVPRQPIITLHSFESYRASKSINQKAVEAAAHQSKIKTVSDAIKQETLKEQNQPSKPKDPIATNNESMTQFIDQNSYQNLLQITKDNPNTLGSNGKLKRQLFKKIINEIENGDTKNSLDILEIAEHLSKRQRNKIQIKTVRQNLNKLLQQDEQEDFSYLYPVFSHIDKTILQREASRINQTVDICLLSPHSKIVRAAVNLIEFLPKNLQEQQSKKITSIIRNKITQDGNNNESKFDTIDLIPYASEQERLNLINLAFSNFDNENVQETLISIAIKSLKPDQIPKIFSTALQSKYHDVQDVVLKNFYTCPREQQNNLVLLGTHSQFPDIHKESIEKIYLLDKKQRIEVYTYGVTQENLQIVGQTLEKSSFIPPETVVNTFKSGLNNPDSNIRFTYFKNISRIPKTSIPEFIHIGINSPYPDVKAKLLQLVSLVSDNEKSDFINLIINSKLGNYLIEPQLYRDYSVSESKPERKNFTKTGSKLILVGGSMKEKTIIKREIPPESFLSWQKIYEDYQLWRDNGFDYVPIEPIISYRFNKANQTVDVISGVLDINLYDWRQISPTLFTPKLLERRKQIINILEKAGISHSEDKFNGHDHQRNFCLRFFRNQNGQPDFTKEPRIYLIDFDQARFITPKENLTLSNS